MSVMTLESQEIVLLALVNEIGRLLDNNFKDATRSRYDNFTLRSLLRIQASYWKFYVTLRQSHSKSLLFNEFHAKFCTTDSINALGLFCRGYGCLRMHKSCWQIWKKKEMWEAVVTSSNYLNNLFSNISFACFKFSKYNNRFLKSMKPLNFQKHIYLIR